MSQIDLSSLHSPSVSRSSKRLAGFEDPKPSKTRARGRDCQRTRTLIPPACHASTLRAAHPSRKFRVVCLALIPVLYRVLPCFAVFCRVMPCNAVSNRVLSVFRSYVCLFRGPFGPLSVWRPHRFSIFRASRIEKSSEGKAWLRTSYPKSTKIVFPRRQVLTTRRPPPCWRSTGSCGIRVRLVRLIGPAIAIILNTCI